MSLSNAVLWLHVLCGLSWIGACAGFTLATMALSEQRVEQRQLVLRIAPALNRLCLVCVGLIPLTGIGNLTFAARARNFRLPTEFMAIVMVKIALLGLMVWAAWRASGDFIALTKPVTVETADGATERVQSLVRLYGIIALTGLAAAGLGLWLTGV